MNYFTRLPRIPYTATEYTDDTGLPVNRTVPDMTVRFQLQSLVTGSESIPFVTYRIQESERADTIAAKFYGSSQYVWLIFLANNMRDWYDWPMSNEEFENYIAKKYESSAGALDGVARSQNEVTPLPDTQYIQLIDGERYFVNRETYLSLGTAVREIKTVYEQEEEANDTRREIKIVEPRIVPSIENQLDALLRA